MPFLSKVGAMPQPKAKKQPKQRPGQKPLSGRSRAQPKGITIEDLKKQTARRLAQEQNHGKGFGATFRSGFGGGGKGNSHHHSQSKNRSRDGGKDAPSASGRGKQSQQQHQQQQQQQRHGQSHNVSVSGHRIGSAQANGHYRGAAFGNPAATGVPVTSNPNGSGSKNHHHWTSRERTVPAQSTQPNARHGVRSSPQAQVFGGGGASNNQFNCRALPKQQFPNELSAGVMAAGVAATATAGDGHAMAGSANPSTGSGASVNSKKSKLPHGLTVQELKQMTKARLQAEAAVERSDGSTNSRDQSLQQQARQFSPIALDGSRFGNEGRRDDFGASDMLNQQQVNIASRSFSDPASDIPASVQVSSSSREQPSPVQAPVPLQTGYHAHHHHHHPSMKTGAIGHMGNNGPYNGGGGSSTTSSMFTADRNQDPYITWPHQQQPQQQQQQQQHRVETWETTSVASNISEYSGFVSQSASDDVSSSPHLRNRSNTAPGNVGFPMENQPRAFSSSPGNVSANAGMMFDTAIGPNRRRAQTLSPHASNKQSKDLASLGFDTHFRGPPPGLQQTKYGGGGVAAASAATRHATPPMHGNNLPAPGGGLWGDIGGPTSPSVIGANRERSLSATSILSTSNSNGDDLSLGHAPRSQSLYPDLGGHESEMIVGRSTQAPNPFAAGFAHDSMRDSSPIVGGSSSVFRGVDTYDQGREGPNRAVASPNNLALGLNGSNGQMGNPMFSRVSSMESVSETVATSVWADLSKSRGSSLRSPELDESIANSLGSILKLSGAAEKLEYEESSTQPATPYGAATPSLF